MTTIPIVTLSDLSDEAPNDPYTPVSFSPRLTAALSYLPKYPGVRVRVANGLCNAGVFTLTSLCERKRCELKRWKNFGKKSLGDLESALAVFGLALADAPTPIVVPDQARPIDAHVQQLQRWIENGLSRCEAEERRLKGLDVVSKVERRILTNVMLILDGREPSIRPEGEVSVTQHWMKRVPMIARPEKTPIDLYAVIQELLDQLTFVKTPRLKEVSRRQCDGISEGTSASYTQGVSLNDTVGIFLNHWGWARPHNRYSFAVFEKIDRRWSQVQSRIEEIKDVIPIAIRTLAAHALFGSRATTDDDPHGSTHAGPGSNA